MHSETVQNSFLSKPLRTFQDYVGLKLHFNGDLVWKRHMVLSLRDEQLLKRKDAYYFIQLAEQHDREKIIQMLISMFKRKRDSWIGEILEEENVEYHKKRMAVIGSLKYAVRTDIERLVMFMEENKIDVRRLLLSDGQSPYIVTHQADIIGGITDETLALLERAFKFCSQDTLDPLWEERKFMLGKYSSWVEVDGDFLKQQLNRLVEAK
ncbi:hypothetical protein [Xanthomonas phage BUDD]|nr:hypothetical protein [Xanthomonas phage BUDD]